MHHSKNLTKIHRSQDNSENQLVSYQSTLKLQTRSPCLTVGQAVSTFHPHTSKTTKQIRL